MIVIKTNMKRIPDKCTKCAACIFINGERVCFINRRKIPYEYIKEKNNWCYVKPKWCPLMEVNVDE